MPHPIPSPQNAQVRITSLPASLSYSPIISYAGDSLILVIYALFISNWPLQLVLSQHNHLASPPSVAHQSHTNATYLWWRTKMSCGSAMVGGIKKCFWWLKGQNCENQDVKASKVSDPPVKDLLTHTTLRCRRDST